MQYVLSNNESAAAVMAATYGVLQHRPRVCSTGVGPGATNAVNGVAHAHLERAPMLLFTDCYPAEMYRHLPRQRVDQVELFRAVTNGLSLLPPIPPSARTVALQLAMEGRPGPVHLDLSDDVMQHEATGLPESIPYLRWDGAPGPEHPAQVQSLAATIRQATRPVLVGGLGINRQQSEPPSTAAGRNAASTSALDRLCQRRPLSDTHPLCGGTLMGSEGRLNY